MQEMDADVGIPAPALICVAVGVAALALSTRTTLPLLSPKKTRCAVTGATFTAVTRPALKAAIATLCPGSGSMGIEQAGIISARVGCVEVIVGIIKITGIDEGSIVVRANGSEGSSSIRTSVDVVVNIGGELIVGITLINMAIGTISTGHFDGSVDARYTVLLRTIVLRSGHELIGAYCRIHGTGIVLGDVVIVGFEINEWFRHSQCDRSLHHCQNK
jgi:hypothetical protein